MGTKYMVQGISKKNFCFYIFFLFLPTFQVTATAITIDELAGICEKMEADIVDLNIAYEWYRETSVPMEEQIEKAAAVERMWNVIPFACKLSVARLLPSSGSDSSLPMFNRFRMEMSSTFAFKDVNFLDDVNFMDVVETTSYNGKICKKLLINRVGSTYSTDGIIASGKEFNNYKQFPITLTPFGFSIFHPEIRQPDDKLLLADILRDKKEFVRIDNTITKVNGFNTIHIDLLTEDNPNDKFVYCHIYFSVDHGYTPVKYEYIYKSGQVSLAFDVQSLEKVAEGLWFPSSGVINNPKSEAKDGFRTTGKILVNQGLTDKDFDIEFPVGTAVYDKINDRDYVVKPAEK